MATTKATKAEADLKIDLGDLCKIPAKELEQHFRNWMERDDNVTRTLQAKLRADLIANFNKTALGKQILSQTTTITGASTTQRLTLSPLILALNTLVAEFLYAQNCHFSLSVFCTEVPFRNTLPDFESMRFFRFSEAEVSEIMLAISGGDKSQALGNEISKEYLANGRASLLFLILKSLLDIAALKTKSTPTAPVSLSPKEKTSGNADEKRDVRGDLHTSNFRHVNKYLIALSRKVKEMADQFKSLQLQREASVEPTLRPHALKSVKKRRYEDLNRSLERITVNLKQMAHAKRKNKHVGAILAAIDGLGAQFTKCATNFDNMQKSLDTKCRMPEDPLRLQQQPPSRTTEKQTETELVEKTYSDWVHEMRNSQNGQKFLDRVELALRKTINKQKQDLLMESEMKLRHQKELLKIRYKQKLMERLSTDAPKEIHRESEKVDEMMEKQLKLLEERNFELMHKLHEADIKPKEEAPITNVHTLEFKNADAVHAPLASHKSRKPKTEDVFKTQRQLQEIIKSVTAQERTVDHIVYDAKLRIQELENESNQLERNFLNYLERQRLQKEATHDTANKLWKYYTREREKMQEKYWQAKRKPTQVGQQCGENWFDEKGKAINCGVQTKPSELQGRCNIVQSSSDVKATALQAKNAILEAKEKFFQKEHWLRAHVERESLNIGEETVLLPRNNENELVMQGRISKIVLKDELFNERTGCSGEPEILQEQSNIKNTQQANMPTGSTGVFIDGVTGECGVDSVKRKVTKSTSSTALLLQHSMHKMQHLFAKTKHADSLTEERNAEIELDMKLCIGSESESDDNADAGGDRVNVNGSNENRLNRQTNQEHNSADDSASINSDDSSKCNTSAEIVAILENQLKKEENGGYQPEIAVGTEELKTEMISETVEENAANPLEAAGISASSSTSTSSGQLHMSVGGGRNSDSSIDIW